MSEEIIKLQQDAAAFDRAAQYLGQAANELAPVLSPTARDALSHVPDAVGSLREKASSLTPERAKLYQRIAIGVGCALGAVYVGTKIARGIHHHKVTSVYRESKRAELAAREREYDIERTLSFAQEHFSAKDFEELYAENDPSTFAGLDVAGCFAILAFEPEPVDGDMTAYRDCYVGASKNMVEGAHRQLSGNGNLYVHADVVYEQPLYVLFFPCEEYDIYARRERLIVALGSGDSYNKVSDLAELD